MSYIIIIIITIIIIILFPIIIIVIIITISIMVLRITGQPVGSVITADEVGAFSILSFFWRCRLCIWPLYIQSLLLLILRKPLASDGNSGGGR